MKKTAGIKYPEGVFYEFAQLDAAVARALMGGVKQILVTKEIIQKILHKDDPAVFYKSVELVDYERASDIQRKAALTSEEIVFGKSEVKIESGALVGNGASE